MKGIFFLLALVSLYGCNLCENEISLTKVSPSGKFQAVSFFRNCGATSGFNTQISIIPTESNLPNDGDNIFIIDNDIQLSINWISNNTILISGNLDHRIYKQEQNFSDVHISYFNNSL